MPQFVLRDLTADDARVVARHRAAMFREMGDLAADDVASLVAATEAFLREAIPNGEYRGWLASPVDDRTIAGGVGVQLRRLLPRPNPQGAGILAGTQGLILNLFVEPEFRRQRLGRQLVETAIAWARQEGLASVVLHASAAGRRLYEELGFVGTSEMRYTGSLGPEFRFR
jgi:GNAT superfamily N-acetyltransferase